MSHLKDIAGMILYFYIFEIILCEKNFLALFVIIILGFMLFKSQLCIKNFDKKLKNQLNKQREFFINSLRHDLRIPAIAQIRIIELINKENFGALNSTQKEILCQLEDSSRCLLNLISLMINTYNMENNTYKLIREKFNLSDVVISSFNELKKQANEKNITFGYKTSVNSLNITADKTEIKKVITNLLSSAISNAYTGENITVEAFAENDKIRLSIKGDDKKDFYSDTYLNTPYTAIGQNIRMGVCKKIIETHKGKILENGSKNSFSFEIPIVCA